MSKYFDNPNLHYSVSEPCGRSYPIHVAEAQEDQTPYSEWQTPGLATQQRIREISIDHKNRSKRTSTVLCDVREVWSYF